MGSFLLGNVFQIRFSNYFYLSFMPGQVNFSDLKRSAQTDHNYRKLGTLCSSIMKQK